MTAHESSTETAASAAPAETTPRPSDFDRSVHRPFRRAAVLGAGTMGAQIAAHLANAGLEVHLLDLPAEEGDPISHVRSLFEQARDRSPDPFFTEKTARRVTLGTFEDDLDVVAEVDWVIEAVIERMDVKQSLLERVEERIDEESVVSTNTSGLPIGQIAEGRSASFRRRFLGTHFFNPPRYMKLLEVVPTERTDPEVLERVRWFGRVHLGKGVVIAEDSPYFIGNRIGVYGLLHAVRAFTEGEYTIEEIDEITGRLIGRAKSATFRTADLVGLDVLVDVAENLYELVPDDDDREMFEVPDLVARLVEEGRTGDKADAGFYRKEDGEIRSIDPNSFEYRSAPDKHLDDLEEVEAIDDLDERLRALYASEGRAGRFFRDHVLELLAYAVRRIPEISDDPADVDRALRWGFGWELGPFETWDALGFERVLADLKERNGGLPDWLREMEETVADGEEDGFYRGRGNEREVFRPGRGYRPDPVPEDEIRLPVVRTEEENLLWENEESALLDVGEGVGLFEFRSKGNTLGRRVLDGLITVIEKAEREGLRGIVVGNDGRNFSYGANLQELSKAALEGEFDQIEAMIRRFQEMTMRVRYAGRPVVVAPHQRVLGGGCEMVMACPQPVAAAETYIGLVELGVGLIPAGGGCTMLAARAHERAPEEHVSEIQDQLQPLFETVAKAEVATSARQAQEYGFLAEDARVVMHEDRRLYAARQEVIRLDEQGYAPPPRRSAIKVLGRPGRAAFEAGAYNMEQSGYASEYDLHLAERLAYVMTGGDLVGPELVDEQYLLDLEREVFMSLLGEEKTQERIAHMLMHKEPLRN